jgi:hypothetical protein
MKHLNCQLTGQGHYRATKTLVGKETHEHEMTARREDRQDLASDGSYREICRD